MAIVGPPEPCGLVLTAACRDLRRALSPVAWTVLEEVALDAVVDGDRTVAATSARRIAAQLELDPGTVATALRLLRSRRVLEFERSPGAAGRFGLASYVVVSAPGVRLLPQCGDSPPVAAPCTVDSGVDDRRSRRGARRPAADRPCSSADGQTAFDLGLGDS